MDVNKWSSAKLHKLASKKKDQQMRPKIYLFGDSIAEQSFDNGGWGLSLAHHFSRTVITVFFPF